MALPTVGTTTGPHLQPAGPSAAPVQALPRTWAVRPPHPQPPLSLPSSIGPQEPATGSRHHCSTHLLIINYTGGPCVLLLRPLGMTCPVRACGCHTRDRHRALGNGGRRTMLR